MAVVSREDLRRGGQPRTRTIDLPELGEGAQMVVRGLDLVSVIAIQEGALMQGASGGGKYNPGMDRMLTFCKALQEPSVSWPEDADWIGTLADGIVQRVIDAALELSYRTQDQYEALKAVMTSNAYVRRIYTTCAEVFHRLPSELEGVSEAEFVTALAALEAEAEEDAKRREARG